MKDPIVASASNRHPKLQAAAACLPTLPGVYLMKDGLGTIVYVGKAKNLRNRVRSYFAKDNSIKTVALMRRVVRIEPIVTENEYEALLLENNLIKRWQPHFNISLKDGKSYPVVRMTKESYPRIFKTRRIVQDGSRYWGPYTNVAELTRLLELLDRIYPLRKCRGAVKPRPRPCLYWHMGRCTAVCAGKSSKQDYQHNLDRIVELLEGDAAELKRRINREIEQAGAGLRFEKAAALRDLLRAIEQTQIAQQVVDFDPDARDYIGYAERDQMGVFALFKMRNGMLQHSDMFYTNALGSAEENIHQFIVQYYDDERNIPARICLPMAIEGHEIGRFFRQRHDRHVDLDIPRDPRAASLSRMAVENARYELVRRLNDTGNIAALRELQEALQLTSAPRIIEGFDIAHVAGTHTIAAMVRFDNGVPRNDNYRQYRIKSLHGAIDDFEAMREVVARRYSRVLNEGLDRPDLILIDGGLGQVNAAYAVLKTLGLEAIATVGLAKRNEEIFRPGDGQPLLLPRRSAALRLLQYVRDEAHRFATTRRAQSQSRQIGLHLLHAIPNVGPVRAARLLTFAGSLEALAGHTPDEIATGCGISRQLATRVIEHLRSTTEEGSATEVTPKQIGGDRSG